MLHFIAGRYTNVRSIHNVLRPRRRYLQLGVRPADPVKETVSAFQQSEGIRKFTILIQDDADHEEPLKRCTMSGIHRQLVHGISGGNRFALRRQAKGSWAMEITLWAEGFNRMFAHRATFCSFVIS